MSNPPTPDPAPLRVSVQVATRQAWTPSAQTLRGWSRTAYREGLAALASSARRPWLTRRPALCIRLIGRHESRCLNDQFRGQYKPTNVLSFPASALELQDGALGDIAICAAIVAAEARAQHKHPRAHWAHMVVHGTLHLLGYDHILPGQAARMERLEVAILRGIGYHDPYQPQPHRAA